MGVSLIAEGAVNQGELRSLAAKTLIHSMTLLVIAVTIIVIAAPWILRAFGPHYDDGGMCLRLLALSALPFGITSVFLSVARVERRMDAVVLVQAVLMMLVLGIGMLLVKRYGALGMSIAWLVVQSMVAAVLTTIQLRKFRGKPEIAHSGTYRLDLDQKLQEGTDSKQAAR
jgi:O-antigen/teichoic acid export membrane protein